MVVRIENVARSPERRIIGPSIRFIDDETGEEIEDVRRATVRIAPDEMVTVELEMMLAGVETTAEARVIGKCPHCGEEVRLSRIAKDGFRVQEKADGGGTPEKSD